MIRRYVIGVTLGVSALATLIHSGSVGAGQASGSVPSGSSDDGRTATRLADGRILLIGGMTPRGVDDGAWLFDPATQAIIKLSARLQRPRAWHTATILPNG